MKWALGLTVEMGTDVERHERGVQMQWSHGSDGWLIFGPISELRDEAADRRKVS